MTREEEKRKSFESNGREETEEREREMCVVLKVQRNRVLSRGRKKRDSQKAVFCHVQEEGEYKKGIPERKRKKR